MSLHQKFGQNWLWVLWGFFHCQRYIIILILFFFKRLSGPGHWSMTKCNVFWKAWISMTDDPYLLMYLISRVLCYFIASNSSHKDLYFACLSDIMIVLSCYRIYIIDFITVSETESSQWLRTEHRQLLLVSNGFHNFLPANT